MTPFLARRFGRSPGPADLPAFFPFVLLLLLTLVGCKNGPVPPALSVRIDVPSDSEGRKFVGVGDGLMIAVRADGTAPVTVTLGQAPVADGALGVVFYGDAGTATTANVTTSGGPDNSARFRLRGDPAHPSAFPDDLALTASVDGTQVAREPVTVLRIALDQEAATLLNDRPVIRALTTTPPTPGLDIAFRFFRLTLKDERIRDAAETFSSVQVTQLDAEAVRTNAKGIARVRMQAGFGGQGAVAGRAEVVYGEGGPGASAYANLYLSNERACCDCCPSGEQDARDTGAKPAGSFAALYAGEMKIHTTDLTIAGRGFGWAFSRSYRSQASHLRPAATGDFVADWAFNYSDDRLIRDGRNIVKFSGELRTDVFIAADTPGVFIAPMEYYEQLVLNDRGDIEIRRRDGLLMTYRGFGEDAEQPAPAAGRLLQMEDRNGNRMRFLHQKPPHLDKVVLTTVVDTMGRNIVYRYYPADDPNPGRRGRLKEVEDFRRDNASPTGRKLRFDYDPAGNLYSVTGPAVLDTPTGNDFPAGKTYRFQQGNLIRTVRTPDAERRTRGRPLPGIPDPQPL
jgi:hypothetical protein